MKFAKYCVIVKASLNKVRERLTIGKTLGGANIKLSFSVSDLTGVSSPKLTEQGLVGEVNQNKHGDLNSFLHAVKKLPFFRLWMVFFHR
ncbi:MAG: hypothetical protein JM58_17660 [Peptococcaceae bacterium BICA1-8]|nr:MAG: hypothetical protein JM58_17660 [Peptococcaceae bacterium BICA1-8]